ncbi:MAG: NAD(P)-dependent oxidoreductase [Lachnospiraceae bacterium]
MKSAVMVGGTGFIGQWLLKELLDNGYSVIVFTRYPGQLGFQEYGNRLEVIRWNGIQNIKEIKLKYNKYDYFFYLAWDGVIPELKNDIDLQLKNIKYAIAAMQFAKENCCGKFIATGTVAEYVFCKHTLNVNEKQSPDDFYGAAKVSTYYMLDVLARQIDIGFIWVIVPSTFGPGRKGNNIINYTIQCLLNKKRPVYGKLEQLWDFLYVSEVVRAIRLVAEKGKCGKVYGIGSGQYKCLKEYIEIIRDIIDPCLELGIGQKTGIQSNVLSSCVDIYDLVKDTGFKTEISFEEGIQRTIKYISDSSR